MELTHYSEFPTQIPVLVEDELFLYPFMISPIFVSDEANIAAINHALESDSLVLIVSSKPHHEKERTFDAVYRQGVIGSIMRKIALPDGRIKILFQGLAKGKITQEMSESYLSAVVDVVKVRATSGQKMDAILEVVREKVRQLASVSNYFPPDLLRTIEENQEHSRIIDLIASSIHLDKERAYKLFIQHNLEEAYILLTDFLVSEIEANKLQKEIRSKVHNRIEKVNKEYFLKEQLKQIQKELGTDNQRNEEIEEYNAKLEKLKPFMPEDAYKESKKQLDRYARMHPDSADANLIQSYLEWVLEIPFGQMAKHKLQISTVESQLDKDHFSLTKPKARIIEYFAVKELMQLRGLSKEEGKGAILCFAGPPGVGKTSLANSIAVALKRPLIRIALGGLEDVNELRGHRRTYIGAMPGRIVQGLIEAKKMNPIIVLDEIDKVARNGRGDPTAVLLEILDPEQNSKFRDYYTNFNIDLSNAIFIATANEVGKIPAPLRDRMEFINVSSYTPQEKYEIARRYLLPQEIAKHGLKKSEITISQAALETVIANYTREPGVRNLRRRIADIVRKVARNLLEDTSVQKVTISQKNLPKYLDKTVFEIDVTDNIDKIGVVNGLAWTAVGGDVLTIEVIRIKGKGAYQLTGSLGDVMKESARIAMSVVKTLVDTEKLAIDAAQIPKSPKEIEDKEQIEVSEVYKRYDLHIHVPDGATPKDGPSAGIAMATAIASILSWRKIRADVAMTGEISLHGDVLPIGGLKEKLIAAHKAQIKRVLIPYKNFERDLDEIPKEVKEAVDIVAVKTIDEVLRYALV
ncbi:MAG: Lon protease [Sulfuricurvum sp. PC08-66]|nr:MAG: Lon protease [Sulfuricurvum sp. PC08-66]